MKKILVVVICSLLVACAGLTGQKVSEENRRVRTLGVLPLLVDVESIDYANRDGLVALLEETSQDVDDWLIEELRKKGTYFDVRKIEGDGQFFGQIVANRSVAGEDAASHHLYTFEPGGISGLTEAHLVDAVLVVIVNGIDRSEKRWSPHNTRMEYLTTNYRSLQYTAAVVAAPAEQLWTRKIPAGDFFLRLDYPDFTEAFWNRTDNVRVKEITLPGLQQTLAENETGLFVDSTRSKLYAAMVRELVGALKKGM